MSYIKGEDNYIKFGNPIKEKEENPDTILSNLTPEDLASTNE